MPPVNPPPVIRLVPSDASRYMRLRRKMLRDAPWAFSATPEDDVALDPAQLASSLGAGENAIFACEEQHAQAIRSSETGSPAGNASTELVAAAGIYRQQSPKFAHRANLWGVFVDERYRGLCLGRPVVGAAVELARSWRGVDFVDLGVSANAPAALALYESLGFVAWGREPETTAWDGQCYDEIFMTLRLADRVEG